MPKKIRWNTGDVLKFHSPSGQTGFVQVLNIKDDFGLLVRISTCESFAGECVLAYVNQESIKHWQKFEGPQIDLPDGSIVENLVFFFGSSATRWTVEAHGTKHYVKANEATFEQMKARGYRHKILWHSKAIEEFIDGKPLVWPFKV